MIRYLIEVSFIHSIFILGYWLFLKNERQYGKMRTYLVASTVLSLCIPVLHLPSVWQYIFTKPSQETSELVTYVLSPATIAHQIPSSDGLIFSVFQWIYLFITGWFLFHFFKNILTLIALERKSQYEKVSGIFVRKIPTLSGTFTFFNWIFISGHLTEDHEEYLPILRHELAHTKLGHTYDLILCELYRAFFWWLPSAWFVRKEIKKIHEYQADAYALKSYSIDQYSSILISSTLKSNGMSLASSFHDGLILKRLKAMKQNVTKIKTWKLSVLAVLSTLLFITFACNEELGAEIKEMGTSNNLITFDQLPMTMQNRLANKKENLTFSKVIVGEDEDINKSSYLQSLDPQLVYSMEVNKESREVFLALKKGSANFDYVSEKSKSDNEVFTIVENGPEYPGGLQEFYKYIGENVTYPLEARQKNIEGRVYVQFVVDTDGTMTDLAVLKGIGSGCDEEAIRVISSAGKWIPGEQRGKKVKVRMVLPVQFLLNEDKNIIVIEEVETSNNQFSVNTNLKDGIWTGNIHDPNGKPMAGVNIVEKGTSIGTVSDRDGTFTLKPSDESDNLVLSYIGYETVEITQTK